jgi:hypothetical protein
MRYTPLLGQSLVNFPSLITFAGASVLLSPSDLADYALPA